MRTPTAPIVRPSSHFSLDQVAAKIAALGASGLVLLLVTRSTGNQGAAAITAGLRRIGRSGGMRRGVMTLAGSTLVLDSAAEYGIDAVAKRVVRLFYERGENTETILTKVERMPLSPELKIRIRDSLEELEKAEEEGAKGSNVFSNQNDH